MVQVGGTDLLARAVTLLLLALVILLDGCGDEEGSPSCDYRTLSVFVAEVPLDVLPNGRGILVARARSKSQPAGVFYIDDQHPKRLTFVRELAVGVEDNYRLRPDGGAIAYVRGDDLFEMDLISRVETRLTTAQVRPEEPNYDFDGRRIVFVRNIDLRTVPDSLEGLFMIDLISMSELHLTNGGRAVYGLDLYFSPSGQRVLFSSGSPLQPRVYDIVTESVSIVATIGDEVRPLCWYGNENVFLAESIRHTLPRRSLCSVSVDRNNGEVASLGLNLYPTGLKPAVARDASVFAYLDEDSSGMNGVTYIQEVSDVDGYTRKRVSYWDVPDPLGVGVDLRLLRQ